MRRPAAEELGHRDQVASAVASVVDGGPADGTSAIDLRVLGGLDVRLLADRGLDVGAAWFAGVPLAWISPLGEHAPRAGDFRGSWGGGLVTTCGLRNVGAASEGHGLHGEYHQQPAHDVEIEREADALVVRARVREGAFEVRRTVRTVIGAGRFSLEDVARNTGSATEPAPLLYHVNLGAPVWSDGATLGLAGSRVVPRDAEAEKGAARWARAPEPQPGAGEWVFEHELAPVSGDGWHAVRLESPPTGLVVTLRWEAAELPRLHQWVHPAPGMMSLGLEPANCSVLGRAADRAAGRLPLLEPGQERVTRLEVAVERYSPPSSTSNCTSSA